jgi:hypothetical protein
MVPLGFTLRSTLIATSIAKNLDPSTPEARGAEGSQLTAAPSSNETTAERAALDADQYRMRDTWISGANRRDISKEAEKQSSSSY